MLNPKEVTQRTMATASQTMTLELDQGDWLTIALQLQVALLTGGSLGFDQESIRPNIEALVDTIQEKFDQVGNDGAWEIIEMGKNAAQVLPVEDVFKWEVN